ncbi:MAG: multidrug DMT transporter permease, partial [Vibrionaceae bacterium]
SGIMRLVSISIAIFIGALILRLISPSKQGMESQSESS